MSMGTKIAGLSPFGPIFGKELRVASRRKRNHLLRVVYLGGLLLFLLAFYTSTILESDRGSVAYRIQQQAVMGQTFFCIFSVFCACCMGLISPVLTSTAINSERLGKTLHVLLMTPITSWQIVSGKLFARLLIALMLIGLSLPVLAVVRLLGGVEVSQMVAVIALCTTFAMSCGALGVLLSSVMNRSYAVILMAYASMFVVYFVVPTLAMISRRGGTVRLEVFLMAINPVLDVGIISNPDGTLLGIAPWMQWVPGVLVQLGLTLVLLIASSIALRRVDRRAGAPAAESADPVPLEQQRMTAKLSAESPPVGDNAILWRELRRPLVANGRGPIAAIIVGLLMICTYMVCSINDLLDEPGLQIGLSWIFNGLYWLLAAVLSATAIAQEKESDTWTLLLATPAGGGSIVMGKFLGVARRMFWPTVLIALHFALFTIGGVVSFTSLLLIIYIIVTFNTVWVSTGIYLSLRMAKVTTAVVLNLLIVVALFGVIPILLVVMGNLFVRRGGQNLVEISGWIMPYPFLGTVIDSLSPRRYPGGSNMWLPYVGDGTPRMEFILIILMLGVMHLFIAAVVLLFTADQFDRIVGRAGQKAPNIQKNPAISSAAVP